MTVRRTMRIPRSVTGDVGIEIEVEGHDLPQIDEYWNTEHDGSLRGESREYVLRRPMSLPEARTALDYLGLRYREEGTRVLPSNRTGVHVHVNCQPLSMLQLYNFMTLYLIFEDVLVKWCGKYREGNHFCLRAKDAEYLLYTLCEAAQDGEFRRRFASDELRYASMNVRALPQYGSLEFRAMRGTEDMDTIYQWAEMLVNLRDRACELSNPVDIICSTSGDGLEAFVRHIMPEAHAQVVFDTPEWEDLLIDGVRRTQEVAYSGDWQALASFPKRRVGGIEVGPTWDDDFPTMDV